MRLKYLSLDDRMYRYVCEQRSRARDPILEDLRRETEALGEVSRMQIGRDQGGYMTLLVAAIGARSAIEVGTFTGYSSICIARGLPARGRLLCVDASAEWTSIARRYWKRAGVQSRIEMRLGPAIPLLRRLERGLKFDFAFIDAAKEEYEAYYELILPRVRRNGLILFDNMLSGGDVAAGRVRSGRVRTLHQLNRKLSRDSRVEAVLLAVGDGIQFCRKR